MNLFKSLLILGLVVFTFLSANATHLVGGNIGYEYIGKVGNLYRYKITLTTYNDCGPTSNIPNPEDPIQPIGIYEHNVSNNPTGGGNKNFLMDLQLNLVSSQVIEPDQPSSCSIGASTCINKGVYEGFVNLPLNFNGYHLVYERCCRNGSIVNLVPSESMAFYAYMSPPLLNNSSPVFTDDPVPFLCVGDTTTILNSAYDPDGDILTFSFVTPYDGELNNGNPAGPPQQPFLVFPIDPVNYAGGYSTAQPFGAGGYTSIGGSTGLTTYYPPAAGDYVVAIEIREFRNGNLIGITRRDLQLLVLNCPPNPAPVIDPALGTTLDVFHVEEGETLCFTYGYNDPNGDSVTITSSGAIFDPALTNPPATITSPASGLDVASADFCWTTACGQARTAPYQFQISARDNGCPPNSGNNVYEIFVDPVQPPINITGPDVICQFATETYTTTLAEPTYTANWTVTGGNIVADNGNSIDVEWTTIGSATVSVSATNQFGCTSESIDYQTTITPAPSVEAGPNIDLCEGDTVTLNGSTSAGPGYTASWTPIGNIINPTTLNPSVYPNDTTEYFLTIDIGGGCFGVDSVMVFVNSPILEAGPDSTICAGDSLQLQATIDGGTFTWTPTTDLSDPLILDPFASPTVTTAYILEVTDVNGCIDSDTVTITVSPAFTLSVSNDTTICAGDCASLSASGATTYAWEPSISLNDSTLANPTVCPSGTTLYTVIGYTGVCSDTSQVNVTIANNPMVDAGSPVSVCQGDTIQLTATGATNYVWTPNVNISNVNIADPLVSPGTTQEYFVTGSDALGCSAIDSVTVTVNANPTVDAGVDKGICISTSNGGSTPTETLDGSGTGTPVWTPSTGLSDPNIFTPIINPAVDTEYILTVTDANLCTNSDTVLVTVFDEVPTDAGNDTIICPGDTITIGGNPSSPAALTTYLWSPAGLVDDPTLANPLAFPTSTTMFYLSTSNDTCNGLDSILVTVRTSPTVLAGADVAICVNDTIQLQASGADSYVWNQQVTLSDSLIADPEVYPTTTTEYNVTGTDAFGCTANDTIEVTVNALPTVDAGINDTICIGETSQLVATGAVNYTWSPTDSLTDPTIANPVANPSLTTDYIVTGTDANTCVNADTVKIVVNPLPLVDAGQDTSMCFNDTIQITATGANNYTWTPIATMSNPNIANPLVFNTVTTMYYVTGTDLNSCVNIDSVAVAVNALPLVTAGNDLQICIGDSAQLQANGASSYSWTPATGLSNPTIDNPMAGPSDTTEYVVTGIDNNLCVNSDTVIVIVNPLPTIFAGNDEDICIGGSANLTVTGAQTYTWTPANSLDDNLSASPIASPDSTTQYIVVGIDSNTCVNSDTMIVNVFRIFTSPDTAVCAGQGVQLDVFGSPANAYTWTPTTGLTDPNIANPIATPITTTTYFVSVTNIGGCQDQDSVIVTIFDAPVASFDWEIEPACEGVFVTFENTSIDGETFLWDFFDGETDTEENTSHTFPYGVAFSTSLTVTNVKGCVTTVTNSDTPLSYEDYFTLRIPNVFTPNGDGDNDQFRISVPGKIYECVDLNIYNRWGQLMFTSTGNNLQWDGHTTAGEKCPEGTYMFIMEVNGEKHSGSISLFR
jgi:gliding motility-associated-like protein